MESQSNARHRHHRHVALSALWPRLGAEYPKPVDVCEVPFPLLGQAAPEAREESEDRMRWQSFPAWVVLAFVVFCAFKIYQETVAFGHVIEGALK